MYIEFSSLNNVALKKIQYQPNNKDNRKTAMISKVKITCNDGLMVTSTSCCCNFMLLNYSFILHKLVDKITTLN